MNGKIGDRVTGRKLREFVSLARSRTNSDARRTQTADNRKADETQDVKIHNVDNYVIDGPPPWLPR